VNSKDLRKNWKTNNKIAQNDHSVHFLLIAAILKAVVGFDLPQYVLSSKAKYLQVNIITVHVVLNHVLSKKDNLASMNMNMNMKAEER
jgi:hypothetical protein